MAVPQLAAAGLKAAQKYGPGVMAAAEKALKAATNGRVSEASVSAVTSYVGNNRNRLAVVSDALLRSGVPVDDVFPSELVSTNPQLLAMRQAATVLAASLKVQYDAGSDRVVPAASASDAAADALRVKRVRAALQVFGSETNYFLLNPTGGIPAGDFAYVKAMERAFSAR